MNTDETRIVPALGFDAQSPAPTSAIEGLSSCRAAPQGMKTERAAAGWCEGRFLIHTPLNWGLNERLIPLSVFHPCQSVAKPCFRLRTWFFTPPE
jgi:hypothetical protein